MHRPMLWPKRSTCEWSKLFQQMARSVASNWCARYHHVRPIFYFVRNVLIGWFWISGLCVRTVYNAWHVMLCIHSIFKFLRSSRDFWKKWFIFSQSSRVLYEDGAARKQPEQVGQLGAKVKRGGGAVKDLLRAGMQKSQQERSSFQRSFGILKLDRGSWGSAATKQHQLPCKQTALFRATPLFLKLKDKSCFYVYVWLYEC